MSKDIFKKIFLVALLVVVFSFISSFNPSQTIAAGSCNTTAYNVHGQLWSSNIGWVYLNCNDSGGGNVDFGVASDANGNWTGYGWSPSVGFLQFGGVGCPTGYTPGGSAYPCDVKVSNIAEPTDYPVSGWAKFITADTPGIGGAGGWNGYVSMSQYNDQVINSSNTTGSSTYGIMASSTLTNTTHSDLYGQAWAGDDIGWLGVCTTSMQSTCDPYIDEVPINTPGTPAITVTASQNIVSSNPLVSSLTTNLTYKIGVNDAQYLAGASCYETINGIATTSGPWHNLPIPTPTASSPVTVTVPADGTTYGITCSPLTNSTLTSVTGSTTIAKVTLTLNPSSNIVPNGSTVKLTYQATEGDAYLTSQCTGTSGSGPPWDVSTLPSPVGGQPVPISNVVVPSGTTTYTIDCLATYQGSTAHIQASTSVGTGVTGLTLTAIPAAGVTDQNHTISLKYAANTPSDFNGTCTTSSSPVSVPTWVGGNPPSPNPSAVTMGGVDVPQDGVVYKVSCPAYISGIRVVPDPYATVTIARPSIYLTASSNLVPSGDPVTLTYGINDGASYFPLLPGGPACTATNSTSSSWTGSKPDLSQAVQSNAPGVSATVPNGTPTVFTITCPVSVPGGVPTTISASTTVGTGVVGVSLLPGSNPVPFNNPNTTLTYSITDGASYFDAAGSCTATSPDATWNNTTSLLPLSSGTPAQSRTIHVPTGGAMYSIDCLAKVNGITTHATDSVFIDTAPVAMTMIANPSAVDDINTTTTLTYSELAGTGPLYNWGGPPGFCHATSIQHEPSWDSTSKTALSGQYPSPIAYSNVQVPYNPTSYIIECPVTVNGTPTTVMASANVGKVSNPQGAVTLTEDNLKLCVNGSPNGTQTSTFHWDDTLTSDTSCSLYKDDNGTYNSNNIVATVAGAHGSFTDGPFSTQATHTYTVKCVGSGNGDVSATDSISVYSMGTTTPINCSIDNWGITLSGGPNTICSTSGITAAFSWSPWPDSSSVPPPYTSSVLYEGPNANETGGSQYATSTSLSGSVSGVGQGGYYWVRYTDSNGDLSTPSGVVSVVQDCTHTLNGPADYGPLCPQGSVSHSVPLVFPWTSNADNCTSPGETSGATGSVHVNAAGTKTVTCTWSDTHQESHTATYGPMLDGSSTVCTTPIVPVNLPKVKEE